MEQKLYTDIDNGKTYLILLRRNMDNDRLIAQISIREDASVEKVASRKISSPIISRMQRADELRKKTVKVEGINKSRFFKLKIQESFENIKKALQFEYGENMELFFRTNDFEVFSRWIEGVTLFDANKKETPIKIHEISRIKNRLRLWVRIFENLYFYHSKGIIHGNIKPQNILIRDRASVDIKQTYESDFFEKKEEVPHIVLLDGGYFHFIPHHEEIENIEERITISKKITERNFWIAPEARGFIEGSFGECSDIFSLAAIMAWDFGLITIEGPSVLNALWPLYVSLDQNVFILGKEWHKWTGKHAIFDTMKRLKTVLLKAVDPLPENRISDAKELAFEIMMISNRLADNVDIQNLTSLYSTFQPENNDSINEKILKKQFKIPEILCEFTLSKNKQDASRIWVDARTTSASKHQLMRSLNMGMSIIKVNSFYHSVKFSAMKVPFSSLDALCHGLLNHTVFLNPTFLQEMKSFLFNLGNQVDSLYYVLPSLRKYGESKNSIKISKQSSFVQIKHQWLYNSIEKLFDKILTASKINLLIVDDLNRSDHSSLKILIEIFKKKQNSIKWILGIRSEEEIYDEEIKKSILQLKQQDLSYSNLKDERTKSYWITKLNKLTSQQARFLATWAMVDLQLNSDIIENLSNKVSVMQEIFSDHYHEGKEQARNLQQSAEDLILNEETTTEKTTLSENEDNDLEELADKKRKDPLHLAYEALNIAIKIGLFSENRDVHTGQLICYYWEHQYIWLSLSLLLNKEIKSKVYFILAEFLCKNSNEKTTLSDIIHISEYLARSNLKIYSYSAYAALIMATEELCDITSTEFIIAKLQMLGESIEKECPEEAPVLIPKIREHIADLSLSLSQFDQADKYYQAVGWNITNPKRKIILLMKSFFPSQIKKRERRTDEFYKLIHQAEESELVIRNSKDTKLSLANEIESEIYKIQKKLLEQVSFSNEEEIKNNKILLRKIVEPIDTSNLKADKTLYLPKVKPIRGIVLAQFLRTSIGWIDNSILFPEILNVLSFTIENNDGESTISLLLSLILCGERNLSPKIRSLVLETVLDLSSRIGNDLSILEAHLMKGWCSFFYDGNLAESKKNIDKINSYHSLELPLTIKQCARKLQLLIEFESMTIENIKNYLTNPQKYLKKLSDYNLTHWEIGLVVFGLQQGQPHLKKFKSDNLFTANILDEKIDQILLYTILLFEKGHAHASSIISQEAKEAQLRQWFFDPSSHIEYIPEKFAQKIIEFSNLKNRLVTGSNSKQKISFINSVRKWAKHLKIKKETASRYWGEDKAIINNLKIDKANTQDTERLHILAQNAIRAGFNWTAYRLAHKARTELSVIIEEIREVEINLRSKLNKEDTKTMIPESSMHSAQATESMRVREYEKTGAYPEQGVAINYVLEFLHNFHDYIEDSNLGDEERLRLAAMIRKSIPKETDIIESTLAGALRASAKRISLTLNTKEDEEPSHRSDTLENPENEENQQNNITALKRTG